MPPFVLPEFYRPYPARLNPNVESAREHTKEWATEHGMVGTALGRSGQPVWTEGKFDAMDFALLCGYAYPDAAPDTLGLLTDWTVWLFYVDDCLVDVHGSSGFAGVQEFLASLEPFMPAAGAESSAAPETPVETSLSDLTARTSPLVSEEWRSRYADGLRDSHSAAVQELVNVADGAVPDPIEYIRMRRATAGGLLGADLVMLATGTEIADSVVCTKPLRVLRESMADAFGLHNDIYSYRRELEEEGSLNNAVHGAQHFLGCSAQEAVDSVNDMVTSRLHQFEHTAAAELPAVFEDLGLDAKQQADVYAYVRSLREYEAGSHEAHLHSGRYEASGPPRTPTVESVFAGPNSMAVQGPRIVGSLGDKDAPHFEMPELYMPWSHRVSPWLGAARTHSLGWVRRTGLLGMPLADGRTWEAGFHDMDGALYSAVTLPDMPLEYLYWYTDWGILGTLIDDAVIDWFYRPGNVSGVRGFVARLLAFAPDDPARLPVPANPIEQAMTELCLRAADLGLGRFASVITEAYLGGLEAETRNHRFDRVPDPVDYIDRRTDEYGQFLPAAARHGVWSVAGLPRELLDSQPIQLMFDATADICWLTNDLYSYRREMLDENGLHNLVLVARRFGVRDVQRAVEVVNDLRSARVRLLQRIGEVRLPALAEEFRLDDSGRTALFGLRDALQLFLAGDQYWYRNNRRQTPRHENTPLTRLVTGPQGLGTSAAHPFRKAVTTR